MRLGLVLLFFSVATTWADPKPVKPPPMEKWFHRVYRTKPKSTWIATRLEKGSPVAELPVDFGRTNEFYTKLSDSGLEMCDDIECVLGLPIDFPPDALLYLFVKDWDNQWYHTQVDAAERVGEELRFQLPLRGVEAQRTWQPGEHFRPWHQLTPGQLREVGIKFTSPKGKELTWAGTVSFQIDTHTRPKHSTFPRILDLRLSPAQHQVGQMTELSFRLEHEYRHPFDDHDVDIRCQVTKPDGSHEVLRGFYYEGFLRDSGNKSAALTPYGPPEFRVRYTPQAPGAHKLRVTGWAIKKRLSIPEIQINVAADDVDWQGFIEKMPDDSRLFRYSQSKAEFLGIGMNVRSPYDTRYRDSFPATQWEDSDLQMYEDLFAKYQKVGINVVEVWMSSWWLGLEWIPDAPGNHGIGYMNQYRSWKLDRLLECAERHDIYLILAIHNHGKFSTWCDPEWKRNPYNTINGGYLGKPEDFFISRQAMDDFRCFADYLTARWGHSSHIMAWKLFTEIDLTGSRLNEYRKPLIAAWHRKAGSYLNKVDPNKHLVTTHWSSNYQKAVASPTLAGLPELDFLCLDAYYLTQLGTSQFYKYMIGTMSYQDRMKKPCLVTEFGGSPWADTLPHIYQQLHLALWLGFFGGFPATPCFWWFPLVEEQNLYGEYAALDRYTKGETRSKLLMLDPEVERPLKCRQIRASDRLLAWVFDSEFYFRNNALSFEGMLQKNVTIPVNGLKPGKYSVEFWNCETGEVIDTRSMEVTSTCTLTLPEFRRDIALKMKLLTTSN